MHTAPSSLVLPSCVFPATPQRSWHPSVTTALGTGEQWEELGLVSSILVLRCRAESVTNICLLQRGTIPPPQDGWWHLQCSCGHGMVMLLFLPLLQFCRERLSGWVVVQRRHRVLCMDCRHCAWPQWLVVGDEVWGRWAVGNLQGHLCWVWEAFFFGVCVGLCSYESTCRSAMPPPAAQFCSGCAVCGAEHCVCLRRDLERGVGTSAPMGLCDGMLSGAVAALAG